MKAVLIDSDVLIEVSRGRDKAILMQWDESSRSETAILVSPVTIAELWHGARPSEHEILDNLFAVLLTIPIDAEVGRMAGEYLKAFFRSHRVELGDAFIAATAAVHGAELWTRNRRHYPMKGLVFYRPSAS